jgi:CubicO group peptidase (beta-lactamase class C family)
MVWLATGFCWSSAQAESLPSSAPADSHPLNHDDVQTWLDGFVPNALKNEDIAGAIVLVIKDGQVLIQKGYGYADLSTKRPMDPVRTVVGIGSVSKLFVWTAVMQLVELGRIDLDADLNRYLDFRIPAAFGKPVTMRNLMTHTAGFAERQKEYTTPGAPPHSLASYMQTVSPPPRIYSPGEIPAYSNYGADLAGYVVERVSGEPFENYVERHILQPLEMHRSAFCKPLPEALQGDAALPYGLASSGKKLPDNANSADPRCGPSGDMVSTANDMSHFMLAHLQDGRFGGFQLLQKQTASQMHQTTFVPMPGAPGSTLGFFNSAYNGRRIIMHDGDLSGFHTDLELIPEERVGFFFNVNSDGTGGLIGGSYRVRAAILHEFINRYFPAPAILTVAPTTPTAQYDSLLAAGEYKLSRPASNDNFMSALYLALRVPIVAHGDGTIETPGFLSLDNGLAQHWREIQPFLWQEVGGQERLYMKVESGRITEWVPEYIPGLVMLPVPLILSARFNLPLLCTSALILLIGSLAWPATLLLRRRKRKHLEPAPREARIYVLVHLSPVIGLAYVLAWFALIAAVGAAFTSLDISLDPWIRAIQVIGLLCMIAAGISVWNAWQTCRQSRHWWLKVCSVAVAVALLDLVWVSFAFSLISRQLNY